MLLLPILLVVEQGLCCWIKTHGTVLCRPVVAGTRVWSVRVACPCNVFGGLAGDAKSARQRRGGVVPARAVLDKTEIPQGRSIARWQ